jgi:hypothetical protein
LPEENASTSILKKNGFVMLGTVWDDEDGNVWEWGYKRHQQTQRARRNEVALNKFSIPATRTEILRRLILFVLITMLETMLSKFYQKEGHV